MILTYNFPVLHHWGVILDFETAKSNFDSWNESKLFKHKNWRNHRSFYHFCVYVWTISKMPLHISAEKEFNLDQISIFGHRQIIIKSSSFQLRNIHRHARINWRIMLTAMICHGMFGFSFWHNCYTVLELHLFSHLASHSSMKMFPKRCPLFI